MHKIEKILSILLFYKQIIRRLINILRRRNRHYVLSYIFVEYICYKVQKLFKQNLHWIVLPDKALKYMLNNLEATRNEYIDHDSCALANIHVSKESTNSWFYISSMVSLRKYKLMIVSISDITENTILISETIQHNLQNALQYEQLHKSCFISPSEDYLIQFASEVKVSLIANPYDCMVELTDALLESYFSRPRYLHINDVFGIDVKTYAESQFYSSGRPITPTIYFTVKSLKLNCNGHSNNVNSCYVVRGESTLIQEAQIHSYIPQKHVYSSLEFGFSLQQNEEIRKLSNDRYPPILSESFKYLESCITPFIKSDIQLPIRPIFLVKGPRGCGKRELVRSISESMGLHLFNVDFAEIQALISAQTEAKLRITLQNAQRCVPCVLHLNNIDIFGKTAEGEKDERIISSFSNEILMLYEECQKFPLIIIATSDEIDIAPEVQRIFIETIHIKHLNQNQRMQLISWSLSNRNITCAMDLSKIAGLCSDFRFADLIALSLHAAKFRHKSMADSRYLLTLVQEDFDQAYEYMQSVYSDSKGAPRVPEVHWEDIGGLADLKHEIIRRIQLPLLDAFGFRQSGLLLYGPPGTGKTLLAKAVATEYQLHFLSVKGPEVLNMYVGQSEKNVRQVFERARAAAPCIIFFDELDSLAPNRGKSGDSGGVMDRVVSQLLAEMDGLEGCSSIFIIGATNRPDLIDPALLRPGRFDKMLYVGIHSDRISQLSVLQALTRKFKFLENGRELEEIINRLPSNVTGADLYSVSANAWLNAVREILIRYDKTKNSNSDFSVKETEIKDNVIVKLKNFLDAICQLVPSVSDKEIERYNRMQLELSLS